MVHRALQWLVTHNQYYSALGVTIDSTVLEQLPQDGNVSDLVSATEPASSSESESSAVSASTSETEDELYDSIYPSHLFLLPPHQ